MAKITGEEAARAAALAAQEAERQHRIEIMAQIQELEREKNECEGLLTGFRGLKGEIEGVSGMLGCCGLAYVNPSLNSFNGITAAASEQGMEGAIKSISTAATSVSDVSDAVGAQIGMLSSYIMELNSKISVLRSSI